MADAIDRPDDEVEQTPLDQAPDNLPVEPTNTGLPEGVLTGPIPPEGLPISLDESFHLKEGDFDKIMAWADTVRIALPKTFEEGGPAKLADCMLGIKAFQTEGESYQILVLREKGRVEEAVITLESTIGIMHDELLRRLKIVGSSADKEAAVGRRLRMWTNELSNWKRYRNKIQTVWQVLGSKMRHMKQTSSDIRTLQKIYENNIHLLGGQQPNMGKRAPSQSDVDRGVQPKDGSPGSVLNMDDLLKNGKQ